MSRYDGLIIPRSYSEYINKTDAATLLQALQLSGVMDSAPTANSNHPTKSSGVYTALAGKIANDPTSSFSDCNSAPVGFVCGQNKANAPNNTTQFIYLLTLRINNEANYQQQICVINNDTSLYRRVRVNGSWGAWYEIINKQEIITLMANKSFGENTDITNGYYTKLTVVINNPYSTTAIAMAARSAGFCIAGISAGDHENATVVGYLKNPGTYTTTFYYKQISPTTAELYWKTTAYTIRTNWQVLTNADHTTITVGQVKNLPEGVTQL